MDVEFVQALWQAMWDAEEEDLLTQHWSTKRELALMLQSINCHEIGLTRIEWDQYKAFCVETLLEQQSDELREFRNRRRTFTA
jgi:hypothetical protein